MSKKFSDLLKKLGVDENWMINYINEPASAHSQFNTSKSLSEYYPILKIIRPIYRLFIK